MAAVIGRPVLGQEVGSARTVVESAAKALGGVDRIRSIRNITLTGYAQYAYQFGGGRITGEPAAPEKYMAANELRRVYDLEHSRFQLAERRNMLFPFLAPVRTQLGAGEPGARRRRRLRHQRREGGARRARKRQSAASRRRARASHADDDESGRAGAGDARPRRRACLRLDVSR